MCLCVCDPVFTTWLSSVGSDQFHTIKWLDKAYSHSAISIRRQFRWWLLFIDVLALRAPHQKIPVKNWVIYIPLHAPMMSLSPARNPSSRHTHAYIYTSNPKDNIIHEWFAYLVWLQDPGIMFNWACLHLRCTYELPTNTHTHTRACTCGTRA